MRDYVQCVDCTMIRVNDDWSGVAVEDVAWFEENIDKNIYTIPKSDAETGEYKVTDFSGEDCVSCGSTEHGCRYHVDVDFR